MSDGMMLRLTRSNGQSVSINGGAVISCEDKYDEEARQNVTVIVTSGDEGDVYLVKERREDVERMLNHYLGGMIRERLRKMEADPSWVSTFQDALNTLQVTLRGMEISEYDLQEIIVKLYQKVAAEYNLREIQRGAKYMRRMQELHDAIMAKKAEKEAKENEQEAKKRDIEPIMGDDSPKFPIRYDIYERYWREGRVREVFIKPDKPVAPIKKGDFIYYDDINDEYKKSIGIDPSRLPDIREKIAELAKKYAKGNEPWQLKATEPWHLKYKRRGE